MSRSRNGRMLLHKNAKGYNPLMLALIKGSASDMDPINVVKLLLESPFSKELIGSTTPLGDSPLHVAARLPSIPLGLSQVFSKTPVDKRFQVNLLGNTPLSEAILAEEMGNALFILQSSNDPKLIQETVTVYKAYIEGFKSRNVSHLDADSLRES